ncbi:MAG: aspartate--tRNA ligase, partial [Thermoleophilia bacterium]|nr:aspartate--tRNA ligase [Thermoleophilia bacterium]
MKYRSEWCGRIGEQHVGTRVRLAGWVHRRRDHGGLIFVDLRDRTGLVQLVFEAGTAADVHEQAQELRSEYVVCAEGTVVARSPERVNPSLPTGGYEVLVDRLEILAAAHTPPFALEDDLEVDETLRLRFRYIDLR